MSDAATNPYPRDLSGYAGAPPHARWPGGARIAVQFVLNLEEGGERCVLHGDPCSESFLSDMDRAEPRPGVRHMSMESLYEYGTRAGAWRVLDLFRARGLPLTIFAVAAAAQRNPQLVERAVADGHEVACHGLRWVDYGHVPADVERAHIAEAVDVLEQLTGRRPVGWYTGRTSPDTRRLVAEHGGFLYDSDDYSDDLPFWSTVEPGQLVVPYSLDTNDMRFASSYGFATASQFAAYLCDAFDVLYEEGTRTPRLMSVGLHGRIIGRPGRFRALTTFLDHIAAHPGVWTPRRVEVAEHWRATYPREAR